MNSDPTIPTYDPARLRALVARTGRSRRDLAAEIGTDQSHLFRILKGERDPGASLLARILAACEASWSDLDHGPTSLPAAPRSIR
jgi:transcriptional regulator with XRE-family HTH domain